MRVAVVGHIEWVTFLRLDRFPGPGDILRASAALEEPAGGGGVAAVELARLAGGCVLFTALGNDDAGQRARVELTARGVEVRAATRPAPQRRATTLLGPGGDRSILVHGPATEPLGADPLSWDDLADCDAVYLCKGDAAAVRRARRARVLVATARILPVLREAAVPVDALVRSAQDPSECYAAGDLPLPPGLVASTEGERGGHYATAAGETGRWIPAPPPPGPQQDTYGAGDSFAAGLTWALAEGLPLPEALAFAAQRGALALGRFGAHGGLQGG